MTQAGVDIKFSDGQKWIGHCFREKCDLLFLNIFHHAVNAILCGNMGAVDQAIGRGVEVLTAVEHQQNN